MTTPRFPSVGIVEAHGHYRLAAVTGSMAAGAGTRLIFYARNTSASKLVLVQELLLDGIIATTAFAAGQIRATAHIARAFTAENGTPGGTALTLTANNAKLRTAMATTALGVARISTTAALAAPTWSLDDNAVGQINTHSSGGFSAATPIIGSVYLPHRELIRRDDSYPIVLAENEGVAVHVTVPETGVWIAGVTMRWAEAAKF